MRVLLVDDDHLLREGLARRLRASGLDVDSAEGVAQAHAFLARGTYGVVISDENMPDGLGHDLLGRVRQEQPTCQRALMSALDPPNVEIAWDRFFAKPDEIEALMTWVVASVSQ